MATTDNTCERPDLRPVAGADEGTGCGPSADRPLPLAALEGVLYLTPDGDGYILYAQPHRSTTDDLAPAC